MILHIHRDASYISEKGIQQKIRGILLHGQKHQHRQKTYQRGNFDHQQSSQTCNVFGSGSRNWGIFINAKEGAVLRTTLEELGHP
jgi:hypothetical protein